MLVSKAAAGLFKNALWKAENVSLGIVKGSRNTIQSDELFFVHKRFKKTSSDEKKKCEDKPKKSRKLAKLATMAVVGTTVAVITAKYDDDFRDWSKEHVPALDSLVKIVFQEEDTYLETLDKAHKNLSDWIKKSLYDLFKENKAQPQIRLSSDGALPALEPCDESKKPYKPPESAFLSGDKEEKKPSKVPKELKDLQDIEEAFGIATRDTIQNVAAIICSLKDYGKLIDYLDQIINSGSVRAWIRIKKSRDEATKGLEKHRDNIVKLKSLEDQWQKKLDENTSVSDDVKAKAVNNRSTMKQDMDKEAGKLRKAQDNAVLAKRNWDKVKQARLHFSEELETLFPNIWLNDEKLDIPVDQLDPFTEKVLNELDTLSRQLARDKTVHDGQLNSATEKYKKGDTQALEDFTEVVVNHEIIKEKKKNDQELQKSMLAHKSKADKNVKGLMKQTAEVYADLTAEALKLKEKEVERKVQQQYEEKLAQLKAQYKMEIAKMIGRMQGANEAIAKRGEKEKSQQVNQQFWSAAQSLMAAVKPISAGQGQGPKPLKNEIDNLIKAKPEGDELVDNVVSTIPEEAKQRGVPSEACLREKFIKVMSCARGWAGVPPGEVSLMQLIFARVQSALYLNVAIPEAELNNEPAIDPEKLNNYDILNRAKYYVDKGEFDQAIRYLNLLKGPSGKVASGWVKDALVYLETKQAAEVLLAHATAAGMQG